MKVWYRISLLISLSLLLVATQVIAAENTYVLSYSPGTLFHQLVRDRIKVVYERAGFKTEFIPLPHKRSLWSANNGRVDGDVGRVPSVEEQYLNLRRINVKLMDLNGAGYTTLPNIKDFDETLLADYRVGYVLGVRWAQKKMQGRNAITAHNYQALFEMLLEGRIDIALATEASAEAVMHRLGAKAVKIRELQPYAISAPIYHYVHKKNAAIIPLLEQALTSINADGVYIFYTGVQSPLFDILRRRLQEAFGRIGRYCEVRSTGSAQRALLTANEKGDGDALRIPAIKNIAPDLTANLFQIPEPIADIELTVYSKDNSLTITGWDSLQGKQNGLRIGSKILEENIPGQQTILPDAERLFQMLNQGRLDTVTEHAVMADFIIMRRKLAGITKLSPPLVSYPGYSYIHKKHRQLIPAIAASLVAMKKDGSFAEIERDVIEQLLVK